MCQGRSFGESLEERREGRPSNRRGPSELMVFANRTGRRPSLKAAVFRQGRSYLIDIASEIYKMSNSKDEQTQSFSEKPNPAEFCRIMVIPWRCHTQN